jgi:WD40 repeat protein
MPQISLLSRWTFAVLALTLLCAFGGVRFSNSPQVGMLRLNHGEVSSLHWLDGNRLWITQKDFDKGRNCVTVWNVKTDEQSTFVTPARCELQSFMPTSDGALAVGFDYAYLPNSIWKPGAPKIQTAGDFEPLLLTHQFLIGWDLDPKGIKIIWWNIKTWRAEYSAPVELPRGYGCYWCGSCADAGPLLRLSREGKFGFLGLFKSSSDRSLAPFQRILVFDTQTGKALRVLKVAQGREEIDDLAGFVTTPDARHLLVFKNTPDRHSDKRFRHTLEWRDAQTGKRLQSWSASFDGAAVSDDGACMASYSNSRNLVQIFGTKSGAWQREIKLIGEADPNAELVMKFSPDGDYLAAVNKYVDANSVTVWQLR